MVAEEEKTS